MQIITNETETNITLHLISNNEKSLSWEEIQGYKDRFYPNKLFVECYPIKSDIVNKANERHLIHIKGLDISFADVTQLDGEINYYSENINQ